MGMFLPLYETPRAVRCGRLNSPKERSTSYCKYHGRTRRTMFFGTPPSMAITRIHQTCSGNMAKRPDSERACTICATSLPLIGCARGGPFIRSSDTSGTDRFSRPNGTISDTCLKSSKSALAPMETTVSGRLKIKSHCRGDPASAGSPFFHVSDQDHEGQSGIDDVQGGIVGAPGMRKRCHSMTLSTRPA